MMLVHRHCCLTLYGSFVIGAILAGEVKQRNLVQLLTSEFIIHSHLHCVNRALYIKRLTEMAFWDLFANDWVYVNSVLWNWAFISKTVSSYFSGRVVNEYMSLICQPLVSELFLIWQWLAAFYSEQLLILMFLLIISLLLIGFLTYHLYLIITNTTTNEVNMSLSTVLGIPWKSNLYAYVSLYI